MNAPDLDDDGEFDVERYTLPDASGITDPYLRSVWAEVVKSFPGGEYVEGGEPHDGDTFRT